MHFVSYVVVFAAGVGVGDYFGPKATQYLLAKVAKAKEIKQAAEDAAKK